MLDLKHEPTHFCGCCRICVRFFFAILPCNLSTVLNCCVGNYLAGKKSTSRPESMLEAKVLVSHCLITMS